MITAMQLESLITMLRSKDIENHVVALGILESHKFDEIKVPIMFCYKFGYNVKNSWQTHAQALYNYVIKEESVKSNNQILTFSELFTAIKMCSTPLEYLPLYFKYYGEFLTYQCEKLGVKKVEINLV